MSKIKTLTGIVTRVGGSQVIFKATSGAIYAADISAATLTRKYGTSMQFSEILVGDKVEATGKLWEDNSISATTLKNFSLYPHNTTFKAKVTALNPYHSSFTMDSRQHGSQTVRTDQLTIFKQNNNVSSFQNLGIGITVTVKATWERNSVNILAKAVSSTVRLINIEFTGPLKGKSGPILTILGNGNVYYIVDTSNTRILSKNGKTISAGEINIDDVLRVTGKHRSEDTNIIAVTIRDQSLSK